MLELGLARQGPNDPEPPLSPARPPPKVMRRYDVERSCIRCHERKVKCDKVTPCTTCVRARATCQYPGPERAKRRSQKCSVAKAGPSTENVAGMDLPAATNSPGQAMPGPQTPNLVPPVGLDSTPSKHDRNVNPASGSGGFLLKEGTSTRYIDEYTFSRVLEKEGDLQSAIDTPESNHGSDARQSVVGFDGLLSNPHTSKDVLSLFPSRWQATQLWQFYLNNVDVLVKLLHVPTMQPKFFAAVNNPRDTPDDMNALLFSIYFAAVTSLRPADIQTTLGQGRQTALDSYQRGLEMCLFQGSFLDSPTIISLQAIAIYLMCRRNHNSGRSGWILNGLIIRAAQSVGLHRDAENFKLPPLECELRRRLWWQILGSDGRVAEDHGLSAGPTGGFGGFSDTKLPTNIDDRDVTPTTVVAPEFQARWTEMTHFLVASEMYQVLQQFNLLSSQEGDDKMTKLKQLLNDAKHRINEKYLQYCDSNIPIQKCSLLLGRLLLGKFEVLVRQQYLRGLTAEESAARTTEDVLTLACETVDMGLEMKTDELLNNFHWLSLTFTDYHLLTYILWHLCVRPGAQGAEKAWTIVNRLFTLAETESWPTPGSKWNVLRKLRDKAADIRQALQVQSSTRNVTAPVEAMVQPQPSTMLDLPYQSDQTIFDFAASVPMFADGMDWDLDTLLFPDWNGQSTGLQGI